MKVLDVNWRLIRFSPAIFIISLLLQIFRLGLLLAPGLVLRTVFDRLATAAPLDWHLWGVIALIVVLAIARIAALLSGVAVESTGYFIVTALLRTNLFECLLRRADARALPAPVGDLVNRLDKDAGNLGTLINLEVLTLGGSVGALVAIGLMLSIDPVIASVVLVPLVLAGFASSLLGSRLMVYQRRNRAADGTVSAFLGEAFSAVQALQVATAEARTVERLRRLNNARRDAAVKQRLFAFMLFDRFVTGIAQFGIGVVVLLAGRAIRAGTFTIGDFALVTYLLPQVADFAFYVGGVLVFLKQARVSLDQVVPLLQGAAPTALVQARPVPWHHVAASEEREVVPQQQLERLTVHGLSYRYPDGGHGITDVHLDLRRGSFTVITGRIGSGKTTVLRALLGLLPKDRGEFRWNGAVINDPAAFFVPPRSAYTAQVPHLFSETLQENILLGCAKSEAELHNAVRLAVLEQDVAALGDGFDTLVGRRGVKLSGGQVQRTAAARMFVRAADLVVVDDLSSALDVETERQLWDNLVASRTAAYLVVSHRRAALQRADHIIVLDHGGIVAEGTLPWLLAHSREFQALWHGAVGAGGSDRRRSHP